MLPVIWNLQAQDDVDDIFTYISIRNRAAAERLAEEIEADCVRVIRVVRGSRMYF